MCGHAGCSGYRQGGLIIGLSWQQKEHQPEREQKIERKQSRAEVNRIQKLLKKWGLSAEKGNTGLLPMLAWKEPNQMSPFLTYGGWVFQFETKLRLYLETIQGKILLRWGPWAIPRGRCSYKRASPRGLMECGDFMDHLVLFILASLWSFAWPPHSSSYKNIFGHIHFLNVGLKTSQNDSKDIPINNYFGAFRPFTFNQKT